MWKATGNVLLFQMHAKASRVPQKDLSPAIAVSQETLRPVFVQRYPFQKQTDTIKLQQAFHIEMHQ